MPNPAPTEPADERRGCGWRALAAGLVAGALCSYARAPLGLDPLQLPALAAEDASLFRAVALIAIAVGLALSGRGLEGRGAGAWLLLGLPLGFGGHALLCGRGAGTTTQLLLASLVAAAALVALGRLGRRPAADAPTPARPHLGGKLGPALAGLGVALGLEGVARGLRLLGGGLPADEGVFGTVFLAAALVGGFGLGRALRTSTGRERARALGPCVTTLACFLALSTTAGFGDPRGLVAYLNTFGIDLSQHGTLIWDAALSLPILALPAFGLGVAVFCCERREQLAGLALGAACGVLLLPGLMGIEVLPGASGALELGAAPTSAGLVRLGALLAASGTLVSLWVRRGDGARDRPALGVALLLGIAALCLPLAAPGGLEPWGVRPVRLALRLELPEGLLTLESDEDTGIDRVRLDRRALTPAAEGAPFDRRWIERAYAQLEPELRAAGGARVLLVGQLTPGRALLLTGLGAGRIDRSASWHEALALVEERLFGGHALPPGEVLPPAEALRRANAGRYDLVLAPPVPGAAPRLPAWEPPGTVVVFGLDGGSRLAPHELSTEVAVTTDLEDLALLVVRGGAQASDRVPGGEPTAWGAPWRSLELRLVEREREHLRALSARLAAAAAEQPGATILRALESHFGAQKESSPFESRVARIELSPESLALFSAAGLREELEPLARESLAALARILEGKREVDLIQAHLVPIADLHYPWVALERALAYASLELLEPEERVERYGAALEEVGGSAGDWSLLADLRAQAGDDAGAARSLERALALAPASPALGRRLAISLVRAGDPAGAAQVRRLLEAAPEDAELRTYLGPGPYPPLPRGPRLELEGGPGHEHGDGHRH